MIVGKQLSIALGGGENHIFDLQTLTSEAETAQYDAVNLAIKFHLSVRQLERDFQRQFRCSPQKWLNMLKIHRAVQMLLSGRAIKEVIYDLHYINRSYFFYQFKMVSGLTPAKFRRMTEIKAKQRNIVQGGALFRAKRVKAGTHRPPGISPVQPVSAAPLRPATTEGVFSSPTPIALVLTGQIQPSTG